MWEIGGQEVSVGIGFIPFLPYPQLIELVQLMEGLGYDHIWCGNEKLYRDMWVTMGLIAANTASLGVATFIAEPYSYHPALIAAAVATVNEATDGRAILLLGAGGFGFQELGLRRFKPVTALEESVELIRRLLASETVSFDGEVVHTNGARLLFEPGTEIPIWIASRGSMILRMAGRVADGVMLATHAQPECQRAALASVLEGCRSTGRDLNDLAIAVRVDICVDHDRKRARKAVKPMIAGMLLASHPNQGFVREAGLSIPRALGSLLNHATFPEVYAAADELLPEEFVDAFSWAGSPDDVAGKVAPVLDAGFTNLCLVPHAPEGSSVLNVVNDFAREVIPRVETLFK
jgi:5,10-methylenetetrahydromethanopterin reductase